MQGGSPEFARLVNKRFVVAQLDSEQNANDAIKSTLSCSNMRAHLLADVSQRSVILAGTSAVHYRVQYFLGTFSWIDVSQRWLCCYRMYRAMYLCTVARAGAQQSYPCPWTEASGARSLPADGVQALYSPPTSLLTDNTHLEQITQQHLQMISPMRPCNGLPLRKARHAAKRRRSNNSLLRPRRWSKRPSWRSAYSLLAHLPAAVSATSAVLSPHRLSGRFAAPASA